MQPIELAKKYLSIFFSGQNMDELLKIFSENLSFIGPFYQFQSAREYVQSLIDDPPKDMSYHIVREFENENCACIIYEMEKGKIKTPMAQIFEVFEGKITKILLVFDSKVFTNVVKSRVGD